jgi:hypothetical protein
MSLEGGGPRRPRARGPIRASGRPIEVWTGFRGDGLRRVRMRAPAALETMDRVVEDSIDEIA